LEVVLTDRGRRGRDWQVRDQSGKTVTAGREKTRQAAGYEATGPCFNCLQVTRKSLTYAGRRKPRGN
jgi:hypothetical protein